MRARSEVALLALVAALAVPDDAWAQGGGRLNYKAARLGVEVKTTHTFTVAVQDQRSYVVAGDKPEAFVGLLRSGFGIPYDVHTESGQGLANDVAFAIARALSDRGVSAGTMNVEPSASRQQIVASSLELATSRTLLLTISEWKTDTYGMTRKSSLVYQLFAELLDENGKPIAYNGLRGEERLQQLPLASDLMGRKLDELLRGPIVGALQEGTGPAPATPASDPSSSPLLMQQVQCKTGDAAPQPMTRLACSQQGGSVEP